MQPNLIKFSHMITLIASKKDPAGMNIARQVEKLGHKVHYINEDIIFANALPEADAYIFLSRHKSESEKPCLTCHFPGNFTADISHGGSGKELGAAFPNLEKSYVKFLSMNKKLVPELEKFEVVIEATHHGPTHFSKPVLFVEIGSSEKEWGIESAGQVVAKSVEMAMYKMEKAKPAIAFGGTHYPQKFTEVLLKGEYAIGHIMPKYQSENFNEAIFRQMMEKSCEKIKYCLIDWKGINRRTEIAELARKYGLEVVRI